MSDNSEITSAEQGLKDFREKLQQEVEKYSQKKEGAIEAQQGLKDFREKELQQYETSRKTPPELHSKLACAVSSDAKTLAAASVKVYENGLALNIAAVGRPETFTAHTVERMPRDMSILKRMWIGATGGNRHSVSDRDLGGTNAGKNNLALHAQDALKECQSQFPKL